MNPSKPTQKLNVYAATGVAHPEYGGNPYLALHAPDAPRGITTERLLAAATYRAAAEVEERLHGANWLAVCVDAQEGRIHLEFAERGHVDPGFARAVLDAVAAEINRKGC